MSMNNTYTLLVFWWTPENIQFYLIPDNELSEEQHNLLRHAHGYLINTINGKNDGTDFLNMAVLEKTKDNENDNANEKYVKYLGALTKYLTYDHNRDFTKSIMNPASSWGDGLTISKMIFSGFCL